MSAIDPTDGRFVGSAFQHAHMQSNTSVGMLPGRSMLRPLKTTFASSVAELRLLPLFSVSHRSNPEAQLSVFFENTMFVLVSGAAIAEGNVARLCCR